MSKFGGSPFKTRPDFVAAHPPIPQQKEPGYRYGNGQLPPGPSIKGKFENITPYKPTRTSTPKIVKTDRTVPTERLTPRFRSPSNRDKKDNEDISVGKVFDFAAVGSSASSTRSMSQVGTPRRAMSVSSLSSMRSSLTSSAASYRRNENVVEHGNHPFLFNSRHYSPRASLHDAYNRRGSFSQPVVPTNSYELSSQNYTSPNFNTLGYTAVNSPNGRNERSLSINVNLVNDDASVSASSISTSILNSTPRTRSRSTPRPYRRPNGISTQSNGLETHNPIRSEKLEGLLNELRQALTEDSTKYADASVDDIFFTTQTPRSRRIQDARMRILHVIDVWQHAATQTLQNLDDMTEYLIQLRNKRVELANQLLSKQATVQALRDQNRSLNNYLSLIRNQAKEAGLARLVADDSPMMLKFVSNVSENTSLAPTTTQYRDSTRNTIVDDVFPPPAEAVEGNFVAVNLHTLSAPQEKDLIKQFPKYAKKLLSASNSPIDNKNDDNNNDNSKKDIVGPNVEIQGSRNETTTNDSSQGTQTIEDMKKITTNNIATGSSLMNSENNMTEGKGQVSNQSPTEMKSDLKSSLDDDEWGAGHDTVNGNNNSTKAMARSMLLKNLSIRAMIALTASQSKSTTDGNSSSSSVLPSSPLKLSNLASKQAEGSSTNEDIAISEDSYSGHVSLLSKLSTISIHDLVNEESKNRSSVSTSLTSKPESIDSKPKSINSHLSSNSPKSFRQKELNGSNGSTSASIPLPPRRPPPTIPSNSSSSNNNNSNHGSYNGNSNKLS